MTAKIPRWPIVLPDDDGIRPAGPIDRCFYCHRLVGAEHLRTCITITKRVLVRYSFEIEIEVPHKWSVEEIEAHRNDSSWCADNAIDELQAHAKSKGCLCSAFHAAYVRTVRTAPRRAHRDAS